MSRSAPPRQRLTLKLEFDDAVGFRASYLSGFPDGGVRVNTSIEIGQRFLLHISFLGIASPLQIHAVVQWSLPAAHPDGPAVGFAFVDPSPEARAWLDNVLDAGPQASASPGCSVRVLLLEVQPFLRDIYGQEVRNWAALRAQGPLELVALDNVAAWLAEVARTPATLGIIDVDGLPTSGLDLYRRVRADPRAAPLPLILIGAPDNLDPLLAVSDDLLSCLRKPLRFGHLMKTVRALARVPLPEPSCPSDSDLD